MRGVASHKSNDTTVTSTTRTARITPANSQQVNRLVGYLEYNQALRNLDPLIRSAKPDELQAIDRIVRGRDEFNVYVNLSRALQTAPSSLAEKPLHDEDKFQRRGLDWVVALARVELGAMLAGFTDVPNPFRATAPADFDRAAFQEILADGARSHYWALARDPALKSVTRSSPTNPQVLSYLRRLILARKMLEASVQASRRQLERGQMAELSQWNEGLNDLQGGFVTKIASFLQSQQQTDVRRTSSAWSERYGIPNCAEIVRGIATELRQGTAQVQSLNQ